VGAILIGVLVDNLPFGQPKRALVSCGVVFLLVCGVWGGGLAFQLKFARGDKSVLGEEVSWDWTVGASTGPVILLLACEISTFDRYHHPLAAP
jgi:hypothetical protein